MVIANYFIEFIFYSFLGWVWESIYCTAKEKKWADRGFLFGPVCPIYGSCVVVTNIVFSFIPALTDPSFPIWGTFIICCLGSAVAEFGTSWVLEKRFHARWWDYSEMPLNIQGRICLPVSLAFGAAGVLIVKYLIPFVNTTRAMFNPYLTVILALAMAMGFGADFALTEASLSSLLKNVEDMHQEFNVRAQGNYEKLASKTEAISAMAEAKAEAISASHAKRVEAITQLYSTRLTRSERKILGNMKKYVPEKKLSKELADSKQKLVEHLKTRL